MERKIIWLGLAVGSTVGSFIPSLFGGSAFGPGAIIWGAVGGIAGIWIGYRLSRY